jgi:hypothetical protein
MKNIFIVVIALAFSLAVAPLTAQEVVNPQGIPVVEKTPNPNYKSDTLRSNGGLITWRKTPNPQKKVREELSNKVFRTDAVIPDEKTRVKSSRTKE